ncbi:MAG TPA: serine/threonine-protein kinase, partial [Steroidobacteraceae bacterium]
MWAAMGLSANELRKLDYLLEQALDLDEAAREPWLNGLGTEYAELLPTVRELLLKHASLETGDLIGSLPAFTAFAPGGLASEMATDSQPISIGPYRLLRELGRGGMGTVWLAERIDGLLKRPVAVKFPHIGDPGESLGRRFAREREILASLVHPHIARLYDAGVTALGQPYIALEFVEGVPLTVYCDTQRLDVRQRLKLFLQVLSAVQYAHAQLIVHRDLKPSNILVTGDGQVRLLDFGIARLLATDDARPAELTEIESRVLTPDYASPEQIGGQPIGAASDVYSLGIVLYELLVGARPYRLKRDSRRALEDAILAASIKPPSSAAGDAALAEARGTSPGKLARLLKGDLDVIAGRAVKKAPQDRYGSVEAFEQDLRRHLDGLPVLAQADSL